MTEIESRKERFWALAAPLLEDGTVEEGTIMGFACLRMNGDFLATAERKTGDLVVKLDADRVAALVEAGHGRPFAPAGRVFREWVAVPDEARWKSVLHEAVAMRRDGPTG